MSELKRFDIVGKYRDEETMYEFRPDGECYDADEADKVIAEKDTKIIQLEAFIENYKRISGEIIANANYQKYKRCLDKAKWCKSMMVFNDRYGTTRKWLHYNRWRKRWLALAEEPTWAKFLQLIHKEGE